MIAAHRGLLPVLTTPSHCLRARLAGCTFSLPPVAMPPRNKSRFRPHSPATFKNPFLTGGDKDQQHCIDSSMPKPLALITSLK